MNKRKSNKVNLAFSFETEKLTKEQVEQICTNLPFETILSLFWKSKCTFPQWYILNHEETQYLIKIDTKVVWFKVVGYG